MRSPHRSPAALRALAAMAVVLAVAAACSGADGNDDGAQAGAPAARGDGSKATEPDNSTGSPSEQTSTTAETTLGDTGSCINPEGFMISYPAGWSVNDGAVTAGCSMFDPEPFAVEAGTDARFATITAFIDDVPFNEVAAPGGGAGHDRAVTAVDGHQAIRVSGTGTGDSLYPEGTAFTRYLIDLALGADEGAGTLFIDVVGVGDIDYDEGRRVLDLMVPTIELTAGSEPVPSTIARYEGGGTPLTVVATVEDGGRICLRPVAGPSPTCPRELGSSSIESVMLEDTESPTLAGTASAGVFRIDAVAGGGTHSFLPVAVPSAPEIKAWALPVGRDEVGELAWFDLDGNELGRTAIDSSDDGGPDPIGALDDQQASSDDAPRSGPPTLLSEVRAAGQDGFDRVVFELDGNGALSYQVELTDKVRAVSGQTVDIAGEAVIEVIMVPASLDGPGSSSDETYQGPERIDPVGTAMATEIVLVDDFESTLVWGIGVPDDARFAVALLADPQRLVIDIS